MLSDWLSVHLQTYWLWVRVPLQQLIYLGSVIHFLEEVLVVCSASDYLHMWQNNTFTIKNKNKRLMY